MEVIVKILTGWMALAGILLLAACQPAALAQPGTDSGSPIPAATDLSSAAPIAVGTPAAPTSTALTAEPAQEGTPASIMETPPAPNQEAMVRLSVENLRKNLNVPSDQITVFEVTAVTWRDASLGCPKPGVDYIRVETPGFNIVLEAGGKTYNYHTDTTQRLIQCATLPPGDIYMTP